MNRDADLVRLVLNGHPEEFAALVRRYERTVFAVAAAVLRDSHRAHDAAQEAFLTAYAKLRSLRNPSAFGTWVLKIVHRKAVRMARRPAQTVSNPERIQPVDPGDKYLDDAAEGLLEAVGRLPAHERAAVLLRYFERCSVKDIADRTGRPVSTVTKQLSRAHRRLRERLEEKGT